MNLFNQPRPPESDGYFTKSEVSLTGLPYWDGQKWMFAERMMSRKILLTKSRLQKFRSAVGKKETPVAFKFSNNGPVPYKYAALYDRSRLEISEDELFPGELFVPGGEHHVP